MECIKTDEKDFQSFLSDKSKIDENEASGNERRNEEICMLKNRQFISVYERRMNVKILVQNYIHQIIREIVLKGMEKIFFELP